MNFRLTSWDRSLVTKLYCSRCEGRARVAKEKAPISCRGLFSVVKYDNEGIEDVPIVPPDMKARNPFVRANG